MKNQGKVREWKGSESMAETLNKPFDPEAAHAASVMKDEANIIDLGSKTAIGDIEENERGGKQSKIKGRMTEVPPLALIEVSAVMAEGAKNYPREADGTCNWHKIGCAENLDHALEHAFNYLSLRNEPDESKDIEAMGEEISHFAARALMTLEQYIREGY